MKTHRAKPAHAGLGWPSVRQARLIGATTGVAVLGLSAVAFAARPIGGATYRGNGPFPKARLRTRTENLFITSEVLYQLS